MTRLIERSVLARLGAPGNFILHTDNSDRQSDLDQSTEEGMAPILALAVAVILGLFVFNLHPKAKITPIAKIGHFISHVARG